MKSSCPLINNCPVSSKAHHLSILLAAHFLVVMKPGRWYRMWNSDKRKRALNHIIKIPRPMHPTSGWHAATIAVAIRHLRELGYIETQKQPPRYRLKESIFDKRPDGRIEKGTYHVD